jgi:hypothetical protein
MQPIIDYNGFTVIMNVLIGQKPLYLIDIERV